MMSLARWRGISFYGPALATLQAFRQDENETYDKGQGGHLLYDACKGGGLWESDRSICSFLENYPLPMRLQIKIGIYRIEERELAIERMCDRAL